MIRSYSYRPFVKINYYAEKALSDRLTRNHFEIFGNELESRNDVLTFSGNGSTKPFQVLGCNTVFSVDLLEKTQCLPLYRYDLEGRRIENITNWALNRFREHYIMTREAVTKEAIFHYVYAVLHHPAYRKKYEVNLKREFPRIPLYDDFWQWSDWGKTLLDLHLNYETAAPYPLQRVDMPKGGKPEVQKQLFTTVAEPEPMFSPAPKARLRADKTAGVIELDTDTLLRGIPPEAWDYKLGNRSALGLDSRPVQRIQTQRPDHRRPIQHLPLRRLQRARH